MSPVQPQSATHFLNGETKFIKVLPISVVNLDRKSTSQLTKNRKMKNMFSSKFVKSSICKKP